MIGVPLVAAAVLFLLPLSLGAADLAKIERRIAKEPDYRSKSPRYCLIVFGRQADTRIWLILDGDVLYIDRNGNGDLSEEGEAVPATAWNLIPGLDDPAQKQRSFKAGEVREASGKTTHVLTFIQERRWEKLVYLVEVQVRGKHEQMANVPVAKTSRQAPIAWFNGPLAMHPYGQTRSLNRGGKPNTLSFAVGTPGLGARTTIAYHGVIPEDALPVADIEFPGQRPGAPPVKTRVRFDHRC